MVEEGKDTSVRDQLDWAGDVFRRTLGYWWLILLIGAAGSAAAYGVVSMRAEFFQSETVIMHRDVIPNDLVRHSGGTGAAAARSMHARFNEMLRAKPLLEPIIEQSGMFTDLIEKEGMQAAVEEMRVLTRLRSRGGGMFNISFRALQPELAQDITRQLAQGLIDWELRLQLESASVTRDFMAEERERLAAELAIREREMAQFLAAHPEFARENQLASAGTGASIRAMTDDNPRTRSSGGTGQRRAFNDLISLERRRAEVKAQLDAGGKDRPVATRTPEQRRADETLTRALRDRDRARRELASLRAQFTDRHPDVVTALARLAEANRTVDGARAALAAATPPPSATADASFDRTALTSELQSLDSQIASVRKQVARSSSSSSKSSSRRRGGPKVADLVGLETQWGQLLREFRAVQERYASIESKAFAADMTASSELARQGTQLTVVSPATLPTGPAGFPSMLLLIAGILASFALGAGVALARVLLDDRIFARRDLERIDSARTLAVIPQ